MEEDEEDEEELLVEAGGPQTAGIVHTELLLVHVVFSSVQNINTMNSLFYSK